MAKPTSTPDWTEGNPSFATVTLEPNGAKKQQGWFADEKPPFQWMNWLFWNLNQWVKYLNAAMKFQLIVSDDFDATHSTLAAAVAAASAGQSILVRKNETLNASVTVSTANLLIEFDPGTTYTKGSATTGLVVSASGVKIRGGRFAGFSTSGDKAIQITSNYAMIRDMRFSSCDTDIEDTIGTSSLVGNITE